MIVKYSKSSAPLVASAAVSALLISSCGTNGSTLDFDPTPDASDTDDVIDSTRAIPDSGATGTPKGTKEGGGGATSVDYDQHDGLDVDFTIDYTADGQHGLEVSVDFILHGSVERNEANVIRALSHAVSEHPDYDLVVVRGFTGGDNSNSANGSKLIEAWYIPENVNEIDLDDPDQAAAYEHCYSCHVLGRHHS